MKTYFSLSPLALTLLVGILFGLTIIVSLAPRYLNQVQAQQSLNPGDPPNPPPSPTPCVTARSAQSRGWAPNSNVTYCTRSTGQVRTAIVAAFTSWTTANSTNGSNVTFTEATDCRTAQTPFSQTERRAKRGTPQ